MSPGIGILPEVLYLFICLEKRVAVSVSSKFKFDRLSSLSNWIHVINKAQIELQVSTNQLRWPGQVAAIKRALGQQLKCHKKAEKNSCVEVNWSQSIILTKYRLNKIIKSF